MYDSSGFGWIELGTVARADEQLTARVIVYRAASVGAGSIIGNELPIIQPHEDAGVAIRGQGKVDGTIVLDLTDLSNCRARPRSGRC